MRVLLHFLITYEINQDEMITYIYNYIYKRENAKKTHRSAFSISLFTKKSSIYQT